MKILYLSPVHPLLTPGNPLPEWQTQASHVRALGELGHSVTVIRYTPPDHIRVTPAERIAINARTVFSTSPVDLVFLSLGADVLLPSIVTLIRDRARAPLVILSGVSPISDGNPRDRKLAPLAHLVITNDPHHAEEWRKLGASRVIVGPISAIDPTIHYPRSFPRNIDVLFAGTLIDGRKRFIQNIQSLLPKNIHVVVRHHVWEEEYANLLSRAKIALNPLRPEMKQGANLRMFEIPAFEALELASCCDPQWLIPGKEIVVYESAQDAVDKIMFYLSHDRLRQKIAAAARRHVVTGHTFVQRFRKILSEAGP